MTWYLYAKCNDHLRFSATSAQRANFQFSTKHYVVKYSMDLWLGNNKNQLPTSSTSLLIGSEFDLLTEIQVSHYLLLEQITPFVLYLIDTPCTW